MANLVPISSLDRDPLKKDFRNFMHKSWMTWFGQAPTPTMYEMGYRLQYGPDRDIIMASRGRAKSYVTVDFAVWALYCDPAILVLTTSASGDGAKGNAILAYSMINGWDWLSHMKPRGDNRSSALAFDVPGSPMAKSESFAAMSLFGQITGRRADLIVPDDVETPNTSGTEGDRQELRLRYAELGGAILKPGGKIKVLGTPQTEQTIYVELARDKGYGMRMWPIYYPVISDDPKKDQLKEYGPWLAPSILKAVQANPELAGTSTEPTRFDEADLMARLLEYGTTEFDRQFNLFLTAGSGNTQPIKLRDIPVMEIPTPVLPTADNPLGTPLKVPGQLTWNPSPATKWENMNVSALNGDSEVYAPVGIDLWQEPEGIILQVDPSGDGSDETTWTVLAQHLGRIFLCAQGATLEGYSEDTMTAIALCAKLWGVQKVRIEKNFGQGMFGELLRPHLLAIGHPCTIEEENAGSVMKEQRIIDTLQPVCTTHRLIINAAVIRQDAEVLKAESHQSVDMAKRTFYRLTYQMTRIQKVRNCIAHDDRVDGLASGVASFVGTLRRILEEAAQQSKDDWIARQTELILEARKAQGLPLLDRMGNPTARPPEGLLGPSWSKSSLRNSPALGRGRQVNIQEKYKMLEPKL